MTKSLLLDPEDESVGTSVKFAQSFNLRLLIHYLGDVHQPLHSSELYSYDFPNGDRGGNSFLIKSDTNPIVTNLHMFWDSIGESEIEEIEIVIH